MYKLLIRPLLFLMQPEKAHYFTFGLLKTLGKIPGVKGLFRQMYTVQDERLVQEVFGLRFENPVGLAAGFDKDAKLVDELAGLGFGFIEIGTLTPKAQPGNEQPRLFRLPADQGLINRMGFNNGGVEEAVARLRQRKSKVLIGGNIGKNKVTENEQAYTDYEKCFDALYPVVDYFVVNVSSPNTPNLRALQEKEPLKQLLLAVQERNAATAAPKPVLLKIAPDLTPEQLDDIIDIVKVTQIAGVIATNTTISRAGLDTPESELSAIGAGGLSGKPVRDRSTEVVRYLHEKSKGAFPIIAVGGIFTGKDALEKLQAGASLVQVYTGFIYEGPGMIKSINRYLLKHWAK
ncbi:quinone-dependent dihydroorotate dehydrogenase [Cytophagales bacterium LB-30]|uniref:Dihydroorotate dehydrogenase (quinone) n=1 Tax=Shiella aurantiaca TaxID=3058365 RepID=A0ABT8F1K3_9BACT|nr:quinone-dependent dihydroorotate dehydrogenase [Shiella aurantiaca]MDN4164285.1 quinone-dependent dihydroorotate dehydrogenase [Shiella aurantiaca]